jgi:hypothetical protein
MPRIHRARLTDCALPTLFLPLHMKQPSFSLAPNLSTANRPVNKQLNKT